MILKKLMAFSFFFIPVLGSTEVIKLNCVMLHDKVVNHSYTVDTQKKFVVTDGGSPVEASITESVISFINHNNASGAVWSHLIQRQNGAMTIIDLKDTKVILNLQCDRVVRNKF